MPAARPVEVELRYRVTDASAAQRVLDGAALDGWEPAGPTRTSQLEDRYMDTADGSIARAGFAARLRHGSGGTVITVKALAARRAAALHEREELEGPADPAFPPHDWRASAARSLILEVAGDAPLVELVTIRQLRRIRPFRAGEDRIEVSLDEVDVVTHGRIVDHFTELEAELRDGSVEALERLGAGLAASPGLTPSPTSKLEVALAAAGIRRPGGEGADTVRPTGRSDGGERGRRRPTASRTGASDAIHAAAAAVVDGPPASLARGDQGAAPPDGAAPGAAPTEGARAPAGAAPEQTRDAEAVETSDGEPAAEGPEAGDTAAEGHDEEAPEKESPDEEAPEEESPDEEAPEEAPEVPEPTKLVVGRSPGVRADDTLAEAGRKVLRFHFAKMLAKEPGTRTGKDPEDLHSMRVATRRMRAAWRVFGEAYRPRRERRYVRDLRDIAARLGGVRDLDVLIEELEDYVGRQAEPERPNLAPLVNAWRRQREDARALLLRTLDAETYGRFVDEYREFVRTEGMGVLPIAPAEPHRVRDRMPTQIWAAYEQVRAYEPILRWADVETLHALRIAAKRLRYTIEFVREPVGQEATPLIERVVALQDHLGYLHDADVAAGLARQFLVDRSSELSESETAAIGRFLVDRERELSRLRRTVGGPWRRVAGLGFRRALGRAVANL